MKALGDLNLKALLESEQFNITKPNGTIFFLSDNGAPLYDPIVDDHEELHRIAGSIAKHGIELYDDVIFNNVE